MRNDMDDKLLTILQRISDSATDIGYGSMVSESAIDGLKQYMEQHDLHSTPDVVCKRCGTRLDDGFCLDDTCPYSGWNQDVPMDLFDIEITTLDRFNACASQGVFVRIKCPEVREDNDLFECQKCKYTFDIEESVREGYDLVCYSCSDEFHESLKDNSLIIE